MATVSKGDGRARYHWKYRLVLARYPMLISFLVLGLVFASMISRLTG